jgi:hypothetical protein
MWCSIFSLKKLRENLSLIKNSPTSTTSMNKFAFVVKDLKRLEIDVSSRRRMDVSINIDLKPLLQSTY